MSTILACGFLPSVCRGAEQILLAAGVNKPHHTAFRCYSATELAERFYAENIGDSRLSEGAWRAQEVGDAWRLTAADLVVANAMNAPWGWANKHNLYFFHYWQTIKPQTRFVLFYTSLARAFADLVEIGANNESQISNLIEEWKSYHRAMLDFYDNNRDTSIMLDADVLIERQNEAANLIIETCDLDKTVSAYVSCSLNRISGVFEMLAHPLLSSDADLLSIEKKVSERLAVRQEAVPKTGMDILSAALRDLGGGQHPNRDADTPGCIQTNGASLNSTVHDASSVLESQEEIRLLKSQLHNVRTELRTAAKMKAASSPDTSKSVEGDEVEAAPDIIIDMCGSIDGENWLPAGPEGRWAGPEKISTVKLPRLNNGKYRIELGVLSTMATDILSGMKLSVGGDDIQLTAGKHDKLKLKTLFMKGRRQRVVKLPARLTGVLNVKPSTDDKEMTLRFEFPRTLSPASQTEKAAKKLAVRLSHISLFAQQNN